MVNGDGYAMLPTGFRDGDFSAEAFQNTMDLFLNREFAAFEFSDFFDNTRDCHDRECI
jgi:hypothetical protein